MLKEIVYWTYYFFERNNKRGWGWTDSLMFVSVSLLFNTTSVLYILEFYLGFRVTKFIPITTKWEIMSWLWAIIIVLPFVLFIYIKYYKTNKIQDIKLSYASKSKVRLILGSLYFLCYCLITWIGFFLVAYYFKH